MKYILILIISIYFAGCQKGASINIGEIPEEGILLNKWQILGPFPAEGKEHFLEVDNLHQFGFDETNITFDELAGIKQEDLPHNMKNQFFESSDFKTDFNKIFNYTNSTTINGYVYCACVLHSDIDRKLKLNFSSDDGAKIWLNHALIFNYDRIEGIKSYDNYLDIYLEKGNNLLLVKVNNVRLGWEMFAALEEESQNGIMRSKQEFSLEFGNYYLQRSVVTNDSLFLNKNLPRGRYILTVLTKEHNRVICDSVSSANESLWNISKLNDGLYMSTLSTQDETFSEAFYKGDIIDAINHLIQETRRFHTDADTKRNIEALTYRYKHLLKPENRGNDDAEKRDWDKKMIFLFSSLDRYYTNLHKDLDPDFNANGGLLKTYISQIDDGIQYYQLFVPKNYQKENPLPLIIELPKFMTRHPSPLETFRFANIRLFELFEDLSDQYNVIILDPGCRTRDQSNMNTIDEADLWEAYSDVRRKYSIDTTRVYLRGACLSCRSAMKLAVKYPDKFAAMALVAPQLTVSTNENVYLKQNEPLNYLRNISNLPILNIHSILDPHSPVVVSDQLNEEARMAGLKNFTYRRLEMEIKTYYSEEYMEDYLTFLKKYSLDLSPDEIHFSTSQLKYNKSFWLSLNKIVSARNASINAKITDNVLTIINRNIDSYTIDLRTLPYSRKKSLIVYDNGKKIFDAIPENISITVNPLNISDKLITKNSSIEGPFTHVLTVPFIIIPGTIGDEQENKSMQAIADTISKYWILRYYTGCRVKRDKDIVEKDIAEYSLLVLGTPQSNSIFKRLEKRLPININDNSIEIGKKKANGPKLGFYFVYPNPENSHRYIAIIGYNNPYAISLGYENGENNSQFNDISNYGWYDFKIWDAATSQDIISGYFDYYWN